MPLHIVDVSRHQVERPDPLDLNKAKAAGIGAVNIQLDRGRQADVLPPWALGYATAARMLGLGVSTYRWLDARIPGAESARRAYDRILALGGPAGMAHVVDCEDNATERHLRDYVTTMTALLGRPIAIYTGRWWLQPRGWQVADLSPYLWAAPSAGYLGTYPGDTSPHWTVAYGGWTTLAAMQYAVTPLPGTGDCSLSAIRDPAVWAALTGGTMATQAYWNWVAAGRPFRRPPWLSELKALARSHGVPFLGDLGSDDERHLQAANPQDHTPFSTTEWPVQISEYVINAIDLGDGPWSDRILADARAGKLPWLKYMNFRRRNYSRKRDGFAGSVSNADTHLHLSGMSDHTRVGLGGYNPFVPPPVLPTPQQEDDMPKIIFAPGRGWARIDTVNWVDIDDNDPDLTVDEQDKATANAIVWGNSVQLTDAQWDALRETYPTA